MTKNGANGRLTEKNDGYQSKREWSYRMATSECRDPRPWACAAENPVTRLLSEEQTPRVKGAQAPE